MTETSIDERKALVFESDAGSSRSKYVAGGLAILIAGWMGSGFIIPSGEAAEGPAKTAAPKLVSVAVRQSSAQAVEQVFVAEGQALPDRDTMIRAETAGEIAEVLVDKGADLEAGEVIARFDPAARRSDLARAEEEKRRAQREYDNADALLERGVATVDRVSQARASLAAAEAALTSAQEAINDTEIRAPFGGRLEALDIDVGEFISLGVKTVEEDNTVVFHKVGIVRAQTDGIWISGLPDDARIISIGQGFVNDGETVSPKAEDTAQAEPAGDVDAGIPEPEEAAKGTGQIIESDAADTDKQELVKAEDRK